MNSEVREMVIRNIYESSANEYTYEDAGDRMKRINEGNKNKRKRKRKRGLGTTELGVQTLWFNQKASMDGELNTHESKGMRRKGRCISLHYYRLPSRER